jgi:hypothetical protein
MKKTLVTLLVCVAVLSAKAQESGFGLGIMLGEPTGLSAKVWTGGDNALAFGLAWGGLGRGGYFHAHGDYLFHNFNVINVSKGKMALHYGPGIRLRTWGSGRYWNNGRYYEARGGYTRLGVRFPVGLTYLFSGAPVDIFLEAAPALDLTPSTSFDVDAALGFRYYFK